MDKSTPLFRSDNYPYEQEKDDDLGHHLIETADGWYRVDLDLITDEFVLTTPKGIEIKDTLTEIHHREALYYFEEGMIYEWLKMIQDKVNRQRSIDGETRTWFKIDGHKYMMRVNTDTLEVILTMPKHTRAFTAKSMYANFIDFTAIQNGKLDDELRKRLRNKGFEFENRPYMVGLTLTSKTIKKK